MAQPHSSAPQQLHDPEGAIPQFSCRIENFREVADLDFGGYYYDGSPGPATPCPPSYPIPRGQESLAELPAPLDRSTSQPSRSGSRRLSKIWGSDGYRAVDGAGSASPPASVLGRTSSTRSRKSGRYSGAIHTAVEVVLESRESTDISLLPAADPIDGAEKQVQDMAMKEPVPEVLGWQEQERAGHLSGGLGVGFKPGATIRETDLLPDDVRASNRASRLSSFSRRKTLLTRSATRKALGQNEADRTGKPIQVIIEDRENNEREDAVDLSVVAGEGMGSEELNEAIFLKPRNTTISSEAPRTETFYPQPNWKPFSMRWPYLSALVIISIVLAALTEVLYQSSAHTPLVSFHTPQEIKSAVYCE